MNRAERRALAHMSKAKKQKLEQLEAKLNEFNNKLEEHEKEIEAIRKFNETPSFYIDNKPVIEGSVIFLKKDNTIKYTDQLRYLVESNHRFAIVYRPFKDEVKTVLVCLLSTSELYNKEMEQGICLQGDYLKNKKVYMDVTKCWIIPCECIEKIDYTLEDRDAAVAAYKLVNDYFEQPKLIIGVKDNTDSLEDYSNYEGLIDESNKGKFKPLKDRLDQTLLTDFIEKLPLEHVKKLIQEDVSKEVQDEIMWRMRRTTYRGECDIDLNNEEEVYKTLFFNAIIGCDEAREAFITTIIKNY